MIYDHKFLVGKKGRQGANADSSRKNHKIRSEELLSSILNEPVYFQESRDKQSPCLSISSIIFAPVVAAKAREPDASPSN